MYAYYCSNQSNSNEVLNALKNKKGKDVSTFLQYCLLLPECNGLTIESYLIKPIQVDFFYLTKKILNAFFLKNQAYL